MTYPDDVLKAAREAAAKYWGELHLTEPDAGWDGFADCARKGEFDGDAEVQSACIAIMAEREKVAALVEATEAAHDTLHECTAVLTNNDAQKVAAVMERLRAALAAFGKGGGGMTTVWVLVLYFGLGYGGGPAIIDNIASHSECVAAARAIKDANQRYYLRGVCLPVKKVKP